MKMKIEIQLDRAELVELITEHTFNRLLPDHIDDEDYDLVVTQLTNYSGATIIVTPKVPPEPEPVNEAPRHGKHGNPGAWDDEVPL